MRHQPLANESTRTNSGDNFHITQHYLPFESERAFGNDYLMFSIHHQIELMFSLRLGSLKLYFTELAGCQQFGALTQRQIFYPITHIAPITPSFWEGKDLEWNTLIRMITPAIALSLPSHFTTRLRIDDLKAFFLYFIAAYNLRMSDPFRHGAFPESWTGHLFLCSAVGLYYLKATNWKDPIFFIGVACRLFCYGRPPRMCYRSRKTPAQNRFIPIFNHE